MAAYGPEAGGRQAASGTVEEPAADLTFRQQFTFYTARSRYEVGGDA